MNTQVETIMPDWATEILNSLPHLCSFAEVAAVSRMARGSVANLHSEGRGPKNSILLGRKRLFPRSDVVAWLVELAESRAA